MTRNKGVVDTAGAEPVGAAAGKGALRRLVAAPDGVSADVYRLCLACVFTLGVSMSVQFLLAAILILSPDRERPPDLTIYGYTFCKPEDDVGYYLMGCAGAVVFALIGALIWNLRLHSVSEPRRRDWARLSAAYLAALALSSVCLFLVLIEPIQRMRLEQGSSSRLCFAVLTAPGILSGLMALLTLRRSFGRGSRVQDVLWDGVMPFLIGLILYIPNWRNLAGLIYENDNAFLHLSAFVMAPCLGFLHGGAIATQVVSQYGLGWPTLVALLSPLVPLGYGYILHGFMLYGCVYFSGVYLFLRLALKDAVWAAVGVFLAVYLLMFAGSDPILNITRWAYPSTTVVRHPFDIWLFIVLLGHLRSGRRSWGIMAAALGGLSLLFVTDTGIYLLGVLAFYALINVMTTKNRGDIPGSRKLSHNTETPPASVSQSEVLLSKTRALNILLYAATYLTVFLAGAAIASRGSFITPRFWAGWMHRILGVEGAAGFGCRPISTSLDMATLVFFATVLIVYLAASGLSLAGALSRAARDHDILWGCIGAYGLAALLYFVARSYPLNVYCGITPFALLMTALGHAVAKRGAALFPSQGFGRVARALFPYVVLTAVGGVMWASEAFQRYPNALAHPDRVLSPSGNAWLCETPKDVYGVPKDEADRFQRVIARLARLKSEGRTVAILSPSATPYCLAGDIPPWQGNAQILLDLTRKKDVRELKDTLADKRPDYVFLHASPPDPLYEDMTQGLQGALQAAYALEDTLAPFEIWRYSVLK